MLFNMNVFAFSKAVSSSACIALLLILLCPWAANAQTDISSECANVVMTQFRDRVTSCVECIRCVSAPVHCLAKRQFDLLTLAEEV